MYYRSSDVRAFQNPLEYFLSLQLMCVSYLIRIFMLQLELNGILVDIWIERIRIKILSFPSNPSSSILMVNVWSLKHPSCFLSRQFFVWTYVSCVQHFLALLFPCAGQWTPLAPHCVSLMTPCTRNIVCNIFLLVSLPTPRAGQNVPPDTMREKRCVPPKHNRGGKGPILTLFTETMCPCPQTRGGTNVPKNTC